MAARARRHAHIVALKAHAFGREDFVGLAILEHAVLMDAGAVRKGVRTNDGLVRRHGFVADLCNERRRSGDVLHHDAGLETFEVTVANVQSGGHFFERRVAGALAQTVHAAFDLTRAHLHGRQRIGRCHAQVVVAVN